MAETTCSHLQLQFVPTVSERPCTIRTRRFLWKCMNVSFSKSGKRASFCVYCRFCCNEASGRILSTQTLTAVSSLVAKVGGCTPERVSMKRANMGTAVRLRSRGSRWCGAGSLPHTAVRGHQSHIWPPRVGGCSAQWMHLDILFNPRLTNLSINLPNEPDDSVRMERKQHYYL